MLSKDDILSIVSSELTNAKDYSDSDTGLEASLALYLGNPDGREIEGRSKVVSTDIADAIEWILPQVMKSFTQNNEIVIFDPIQPGDERQAELESEYVYEVLMKQNDGFIILHQFVKDALMQRNGILKVYYAEKDIIKTSEWSGISDEQVKQLLSGEGIELISQHEYIDQEATLAKQQQLGQQLQQISQQVQQLMSNPQAQQMAQQNPQQAAQMIQKAKQHMAQLQQDIQQPIVRYNVTVSVTRTQGQIYVDSVPLEEFRIVSQHNSINPESARFTAHVTGKTASDIMLEYGLSKEEIKDLPQDCTNYEKTYRWSLQDGSFFNDDNDSEDDSQKKYDLSECFIMIDIEENGISKLTKITVAGDESPTELISVEEIDNSPWISTTAFLMSHKFEGLSITDRLKQIQEQKTTLWRNMFDNMYLQNNQRNVVVEGQVNMDDLLVSRPGGIIRAKRAGAIEPLVTPQLGQDAYNMMEYLDRVRAGRTGVDPDGQATPQNIGDRVGSEGVDRLMNAKEELVGLIIRVIAETGVKPLCVKIRDLSVMHIDAVLDFKFRGVWHQVNPTQWMDRSKCTVRVGTGSGNHALQIQAITQVMGIQEKIFANPGQALINEQKTFDAIDDFCKFSGLNGATKYFLDPTSPEGKQQRETINGQQKQQSDEMKKKEEEMMNLQKKLGDAEASKAQTAQQNVMIKGQIDSMKNQLTSQKQGYEAQIGGLEQQIKQSKMIMDQIAKNEQIDIQKYQIDSNVALELTKLEMDDEREAEQEFTENRDEVNAA